jgi:hypothetical protein
VSRHRSSDLALVWIAVAVFVQVRRLLWLFGR